MVGPLTGGVAVLLVASAFSASEIAIFSLERHRLSQLLDRPGSAAAALGRLRENPHRLLVTILVGNNVVNVAIAGVSTLVLAELVGPGLGPLAATVATSSLVLLFGEISPKSYGVANAKSLSLAVTRPLAALQLLLYPAVAFSI
jgi:Mg2+/Co2+ transporter CorB